MSLSVHICTADYYLPLSLHIDPQRGGGNIAKLHSPDKVSNPIQATTWKYVSNDEWIESNDILVGPGM